MTEPIAGAPRRTSPTNIATAAPDLRDAEWFHPAAVAAVELAPPRAHGNTERILLGADGARQIDSTRDAWAL
eukprot:6945004-Pyramimonas_sp.AAC.1